MDDFKEFFVSQKGDQDFETIGEALGAAKNFADREVIIHIQAGTYNERLIINQDHITFMGVEGKTIITYNDYANEILSDGIKRGTFRTPSVFIDADYFKACFVTFENNAGQGDKVGQALAVYADGDHLVFEGCRFLGRQDTLFAAPLPLKEKEPGGFRGPKEFAPRRLGKHYYKDCYIEGNVDFIFGGATAYFENCEIFMKNREGEVKGYVTAPSTFEEVPYGFVFYKCKFTSDCPERSAYLGRPWREYAKTVILESEIGPHIKEEGFHDWNKKDAWDKMFFAEYKNTGIGATGKRAPYVHTLTDEEALKYTKKNVLGW